MEEVCIGFYFMENLRRCKGGVVAGMVRMPCMGIVRVALLALTPSSCGEVRLSLALGLVAAILLR